MKRRRSVSTLPTCIWNGPVRPKAPLGYDEILASAPHKRITVDDLTRFALEKPGIDKNKWEGSARWWYKKLLENDTVVKKIRPAEVSDETFPHFVNSSAYWKGRVALSGDEVVICLSTDMYSLWDAVNAWLKHRQQTTGRKLDNGWYRHAVRLAARYQWWTLAATENWHREVQSKRTKACEADVEERGSQVVSDASDLSTACQDMEKVLAGLPVIRDETMRAAVRRAEEFLDRKHEEGDETIVAPVIFLGNVPELADHPGEMTTCQVRDYIKKRFKAMTKSQFARGWHGMEAYFKEHPKGEGYGYVARTGWMSVDHVLAQYFGMFHHPRFYALMPPAVNAHLRDSPPIARMGFGMKRHEMSLMHTWMKSIEISARQRKIQDALLADLVKNHPVTC